MAEITKEAVQEKLDKGEKLTKEESDFVMSSPPDGVEEKTAGEEEVDFENAEDLDGKNKAASGKKDDAALPAGEGARAGDAKTDEATKKAEKEKADAAAKAAEAEAADKKKKEAEEGIFQKVEKELEKPEGQEDLTGLTEREKGLYYALKTERKKRQKAEEDRDVVLFQDIKVRKVAEAKAAAEKAAKEEGLEIGIELEGEDDDFITVKDAKKIVDALKKARVGKAKAEEGDVDEIVAENRKTALRIAEMSARDVVEARTAGGQKDLPDYDLTMKIGEMIVESNPEYQKEIYKAYTTGKNPALITYDLVRKDPKFATLYGKKEEKPAEKPDDKAKAGKENLKKIEENENKPNTSGKQGGGSAEGLEGYTADQLVAMSPSQFRKVPKHIREKFLYNT